MLLLLRSKESVFWPNYWCPPGGGQEPGESHLATAERELEEETGIRGIPLKTLGRCEMERRNSPEMEAAQDPPKLWSLPGDRIEVHAFWSALTRRPEVRLDLTENSEFVWVGVEGIPDLRVMPWHVPFARSALGLAQRSP